MIQCLFTAPLSFFTMAIFQRLEWFAIRVTMDAVAIQNTFTLAMGKRIMLTLLRMVFGNPLQEKKGEACLLAKLKETEVRCVLETYPKLKYGEKGAFAKRLGVHRDHLSRIVNGGCWAHLQPGSV